MNVRFTVVAFNDRERILHYLRVHAPEVLEKVEYAIQSALQMLVEYPESGYETDFPRVRVAFVQRFRYKIFYRVQKDEIQILHIRHTSRHPLNTR